jgi:hypothetical protein
LYSDDISFYESNPAGRGLDFADTSDIRGDFLRCAIELNRMNLIADITKTSLPPLKNLAEGVTIQLTASLQLGPQPRITLDKALRTSSSNPDWSRIPRGACTRDMSFNTHRGAGGYVSPSRI